MKKIGKEVLFIPTKEGNPRNGESTFVRLKDGGILHGYTEYYGVQWHDHAIAHICGVISYDEGETWSEKIVILEKDEEALNIMSPSLFRMANGSLGIIYLRKDMKSPNHVICMPYFRHSEDEGKTWSEPVCCVEKEGYYCTVNDTVKIGKNGRVYLPASYHGIGYDPRKGCIHGEDDYVNAVIKLIYTDDYKEWKLCDGEIRSPFHDVTGFAEPGVLELDDGRLWCWFRSAYGFQYNAYSSDKGKTWTEPRPNFHFSSPDSPMCVKRVGNFTVAVFNPIPFSSVTTDVEVWGSAKRTPLVCAFTTDSGEAFDSTDKSLADGGIKAFTKNIATLEDDSRNSYCYPVIFEVKDGFLVSYYHSNNTPVCLNSTKITKVTFDEIKDL